MMHLFSTILHVRCTVLDRDCNGRCVGTHGKNVQQCHSPDSGTITQKCQPKCLCLLQQSCLVCLIPCLKVQVLQFTPNFFQSGQTNSSPQSRATLITRQNLADSTTLSGMFSVWNKSAMANSSVALWHLQISRWFWKDVDIDGWKDLLVEE